MTFEADPKRTREVGIRALSRDTSPILRGVRDGERVIVTKHGNPMAVILAIEDAIDLFLISSEEFVQMRLSAREELENDQ